MTLIKTFLSKINWLKKFALSGQIFFYNNYAINYTLWKWNRIDKIQKQNYKN